MTETARTELVSKIIPPGIIPTIDATVLSTVCLILPSKIPNCLINNITPIGTIIIVQILTINLKDFKI